MTRITNYLRSRLANRILSYSDPVVAATRARKYVETAADGMLPGWAKTAIRKGQREHLQTDFVCVASVYVNVPSVVDAGLLRAMTSATARRLCPHKLDGSRRPIRKAVLDKLGCPTTRNRALELHPELAPLLAELLDDAPAPDPVKMRRALLRAGWPLRVKDL